MRGRVREGQFETEAYEHASRQAVQVLQSAL